MEIEEQGSNSFFIENTEQNFKSDDSVKQYQSSDNSDDDQLSSRSNQSTSNYEPNKQKKQEQQISIRKNKNLKKVEYIFLNIPAQNRLVNQEFFYCNGDIVIDFKKKDNCLDDRYSVWNVCKMLNVTQIKKDIGILIVNIENKFVPDFNYFYNQIQKYKMYPDQQIHCLMSDLEKYIEFSKQINKLLQQYFQTIKQSPQLMNQYYERKNLLDQYMEPVYKKLSEEGAIFFGTHSGPDINTCDFQFHRSIYSESLAMILGKSLEELQIMFRRNGIYDFYDFESQLEILKAIINSQLNIFKLYQQGIYNVKSKKIQMDKQFKMITYDDIVFYANTSILMYKLSDFTGDESYSIDFFAGILFFEISPQTIMSIITIRQQNQEQKNLALVQSQPCFGQNLEYTIQAEIFKEKFIDQKQNINNDENKRCNFKHI